LPIERLGVRLSELKARVFDTVQRAGPDGIHGDELYALVFGERCVKRKTMLVHVHQINDKIEETGFRIDGRGGFFRLRRMAGSEQHGAVFLGMART